LALRVLMLGRLRTSALPASYGPECGGSTFTSGGSCSLGRVFFWLRLICFCAFTAPIFTARPDPADLKDASMIRTSAKPSRPSGSGRFPLRTHSGKSGSVLGQNAAPGAVRCISAEPNERKTPRPLSAAVFCRFLDLLYSVAIVPDRNTVAPCRISRVSPSTSKSRSTSPASGIVENTIVPVPVAATVNVPRTVPSMTTS